MTDRKRRPASKSPTARSLEALRKDGYLAERVEQRVPVINTSRDFLGIIDLIAVKSGCPILGVQATSGSNVAARVRKALASPGLAVWLAAGGVFEVWGWAKRGGRGKRKLWTLDRRAVVLEESKVGEKNQR